MYQNAERKPNGLNLKSLHCKCISPTKSRYASYLFSRHSFNTNSSNHLVLGGQAFKIASQPYYDQLVGICIYIISHCKYLYCNLKLRPFEFVEAYDYVVWNTWFEISAIHPWCPYNVVVCNQNSICLSLKLTNSTKFYNFFRKRVDKGLSQHKTLVREVGGAMAPIWSSCKHLLSILSWSKMYIMY